MFNVFKNLFTKAVQLTANIFQPSEIIEEELIVNQTKSEENFNKSEVTNTEPKIKRLKKSKK